MKKWKELDESLMKEINEDYLAYKNGKDISGQNIDDFFAELEL